MWRKIQDDEIWINPEPFNKRDAWIDLLLMTWAKDKNFIIGKKVVELKDGQIFLSYRFLSSKWHWSKHKIGDYLSLLRDLKKLTFEPHPEGTLITICKWETYQGIFDSQGTLTDVKRGHLGDAQGTLRGRSGDKTKNDKEDVKEVLENVKDLKDGEEKISPQLDKSPKEEKDRTADIKKLEDAVFKDFSVKAEKKMIQPLWDLYGKYFPNCNGRNWGVFVKILRGEGYPMLTEEQIGEAIEGTHQDHLFQRLDNPWARFLDRVLKIPKYAP